MNAEGTAARQGGTALEQAGSPDAVVVPPEPAADGCATLRVVAVGASAGGLDALERLFGALPTDTGAAFVVIQHLSPDHKSMMASLLSRHTAMAVRTAEEGMPLSPDVIHLIPPGVMMRLEGGCLRLRPKLGSALHLPIDEFLASLAQEVGPDAVAVIVSGTGSDGTRGAGEIHAAGGMLMAQEPESARFDGMPRSVIATGLVDAVLPVEGLAERLVTYLSRGRVELSEGASAASPDVEGAGGSDPWSELFVRLHGWCGIDFARYKPGTVRRRLERRMAVRHVGGLRDYLKLLEEDPSEQQVLVRELLIPVTSFFRDSQAFDALREHVVDPLVTGREGRDPIRIWSAGTSTGEEAYSLAMLFLDAFERHQRWPGLKLFATDVSAASLETASAGIYPATAIAEVPEAFRERFFLRSGDLVNVRSDLRQAIVFARHNLLADPPFTRMDLVVCRNTLIYFGAGAQTLVMRKLQYALSPERFLFLGGSESIGALQADFGPVSAPHRIWQVRRAAPQLSLQMDRVSAGLPAPRRAVREASPAEPAAMTTADRAQAPLLARYGPPPAILVDRHQKIVHAYGDVDTLLSVRAGTASLSLSGLLPSPLAAVASALMHRAFSSGQTQMSEPVTIEPERGQARRRLRLVVVPIDGGAADHQLVVFEDARLAAEEAEALPRVDLPVAQAERIALLEAELAATRETLQATIEQLETANEELQATNEEMMASNEELQSANEELQSVNEELNTVNAEYQEKLEILNRVNADLDSLTQVVSSGAVFVDEQMRLTRFNPGAERIFRVRPHDIGRPLADLNHSLDHPTLHIDLQQTIERAERIEREVQGPEGRHYLLRILPYRIPSSTRKGAVLSVIDMTETKTAQRLQGILDGLGEHVAVLDADGRIQLVNEGWIRFARENGDRDLLRSGPGANYLEACEADPKLPDAEYAGRAAEGVREVLQGRRSHFSMQYPCDAPHEARWFVMHVRPLAGGFTGAVVSHVDISTWYGASAEVDASMEEEADEA